MCIGIENAFLILILGSLSIDHYLSMDEPSFDEN